MDPGSTELFTKLATNATQDRNIEFVPPSKRSSGDRWPTLRPLSGSVRLAEKSEKACGKIAAYIEFLVGKEKLQPLELEDKTVGQWHWLGGGTRTDPFRCIPGLAVFGEAGRAFDWLCQYVSPNIASICQPFGVSNLYGRWLLEQMSIYLDVFHVMIAALHGGLVNLTSPGTPHRSYALMHKIWALQALQQRLAGPHAWKDDGPVLTML